jgi:hypothetical protein
MGWNVAGVLLCFLIVYTLKRQSKIKSTITINVINHLNTKYSIVHKICTIKNPKKKKLAQFVTHQSIYNDSGSRIVLKRVGIYVY